MLTKMGGSGAPDDMKQAHLTQAWLAAGDDQSHDVALQDRLIVICTEISGVLLPA